MLDVIIRLTVTMNIFLFPACLYTLRIKVCILKYLSKKHENFDKMFDNNDRNIASNLLNINVSY